MSDDSNLLNEMRRLNSAFGIGIIKLNLDNVDESEIVLQSRINPELDWNTINRLVEDNPDFKEFMEDVQADVKTQ